MTETRGPYNVVHIVTTRERPWLKWHTPDPQNIYISLVEEDYMSSFNIANIRVIDISGDTDSPNSNRRLGRFLIYCACQLYLLQRKPWDLCQKGNQIYNTIK